MLVSAHSIIMLITLSLRLTVLLITVNVPDDSRQFADYSKRFKMPITDYSECFILSD